MSGRHTGSADAAHESTKILAVRVVASTLKTAGRAYRGLRVDVRCSLGIDEGRLQECGEMPCEPAP